MMPHIGTQEVRIDLSATAPRVYVDGKEAAFVIDIKYRPPPEEGLTVERIILELTRRTP